MFVEQPLIVHERLIMAVQRLCREGWTFSVVSTTSPDPDFAADIPKIAISRGDDRVILDHLYPVLQMVQAHPRRRRAEEILTRVDVQDGRPVIPPELCPESLSETLEGLGLVDGGRVKVTIELEPETA